MLGIFEHVILVRAELKFESIQILWLHNLFYQTQEVLQYYWKRQSAQSAQFVKK